MTISLATQARDTSAEERLAALADTARADLAMLAFPHKPWVISRTHEGKPIPDVVIIGAGQSGLVVGHALKRRGVGNVLLLDRNREGYEGVWETYARNHEMRSPKEIMGVDLGIPSLSIQRYYETRYGEQAWADLVRVPRTDWMDYLRWYRAIVDLPVRNETTAVDIQFDPEGVTTVLADGEKIRSRYLVIATGMDGGGAWQVPEIITANLPPERYDHTSDMIDISKLAGKRVGVLGGGASAFDIAVVALEARAASVDMFLRRKDIPVIDATRELETTGLLDHFHELSDATKWNLSRFMGTLSQAPAEHHFHKALTFPNFHIHLGSPWDKVGMDGADIAIRTGKGEDYRFDHIFSATGVAMDLNMRPELSRIAAKAALWRDRFTPPEPEDAASWRLSYPYLDGEYRFIEREPGSAPGMERIYVFNAMAYLSMGSMSATAISCHRYGAPRLAANITRAIMLEQELEIVPTLAAFKKPGLIMTPELRARLGTAPEG